MSKKRIFLPFIFILFCSCNINSHLSSNKNTTPKRDPQDVPNFPGVTTNTEEREIFRLANQYRQSKGMNALLWQQQAIIESQDHSQDMAAFRTPVAHIGSSLRFSRIRNSDADAISKFGENVAKNASANKAFLAWLSSPGHHRNILGNYTHTGIGAVKSANGSWYYTQIFLKK